MSIVETVMRVMDEHPDCPFEIMPDALRFKCGIDLPVGEGRESILAARRKHLVQALTDALKPVEEHLDRITQWDPGQCGDVCPGYPEVTCQKVKGHTTYGHWADSDEVLYGRTWQPS